MAAKSDGGNASIALEVYPTPCGTRNCSMSNFGTYFIPGDPWECNWPDELRIVLYALLLIWLFLGVAIIANVFMEGIEEVTSATKTTKDGRKVRVWNPTVANLSLMALGSSAPEIILNVIEVVGAIGKGVGTGLVVGDAPGFGQGLKMEGSLGPGTIVGSASFNLLVIIGICSISIPRGQLRKIDEMPAYVFTAFCAVRRRPHPTASRRRRAPPPDEPPPARAPPAADAAPPLPQVGVYVWLVFVLMGTRG